MFRPQTSNLKPIAAEGNHLQPLNPEPCQVPDGHQNLLSALVDLIDDVGHCVINAVLLQ